MKLLQVFAFVLLASITGGNITETNRYKELAQEAYLQGDFPQAIQHYHYLIDTLNLNDPALSLNLGHAYFNYWKSLERNASMLPEKDGENLKTETGIKMVDYYSRAAQFTNDKQVRASAFHQIGVALMGLTQDQDPNDKDAVSLEESYKRALDAFKSALKNDPYNEDTRYNYELVKKLYEAYKKQQEEQKKDQPEQDDKQKEDKDKSEEEKKKEEEEKQKGKDKNEQEGEKGDKEKQEGDKGDKEEDKQEGAEKEDSESSDEKEGDPDKNGAGEPKEEEGGKTDGGADNEGDPTKEQKEAMKKAMQSKRMKEINMSKEKAKMILDAMKAQEMQYYQNMKKGVRKARKSSKPDW